MKKDRERKILYPFSKCHFANLTIGTYKNLFACSVDKTRHHILITEELYKVLRAVIP